MPNAAGFWSYVREDDQDSMGRIRRLSEHLKAEYRMQSGTDLDLFIDRDIKWGEEWESRIQEALQQTTFLIPVITPRFFGSEACRRELLEFVAEARSLGVEQLVLPIYYVQVAGLEAEDPPDEAMAVVKRTEWEDVRELRHEAEESAPYRKMVAGLAARLIDIAKEVEASAPSPSSSPAGGNEGGEPLVKPASEEPEGHLEALASAEEAMPKVGDAVDSLGSAMHELTAVAEAYTPRMQGAETFAKRLAIAKRMADELEPIAERIEERASNYAALLSEVDPGVMTMIRFAAEEGSDANDAAEFAEGVRGLVAISRESGTQLDDFATVLESTAKFSRDLKRPLGKIQTGLRNVVDANAIMERWEARLDELGIGSIDESPEPEKPQADA